MRRRKQTIALRVSQTFAAYHYAADMLFQRRRRIETRCRVTALYADAQTNEKCACANARRSRAAVARVPFTVSDGRLLSTRVHADAAADVFA